MQCTKKLFTGEKWQLIKQPINQKGFNNWENLDLKFLQTIDLNYGLKYLLNFLNSFNPS